MSTQTAILIGLIIYGCLMLAVSLFFMARVKKAADYFVAGRGGVPNNCREPSAGIMQSNVECPLPAKK